MLIPLGPALRDPFRGWDDFPFLVSTSLSRGCQHSMTIMASASRAVQEPVALPIPVTGPGSGPAFTSRTHAKQRHVCATRGFLKGRPLHSGDRGYLVGRTGVNS